MAKNSFLEWDTTASSNTDIAGIGIQGSNAVQNFDDALRTCMAQARSGIDGKMVYVNKTANYTALANDNNAFFDVSATSVTISLTAAATLAANWHCWIWANGYDVIIDPNSTELINGAATLTIKNGALALIQCTGSAFKAASLDLSSKLDTIQPLFTIASATTTDLSTVTTIEGTITGTTTITGLGTVAAGTFRSVYFAASLTLTHNATSLILPTGANIQTVAGDSATFISLGSGNWRCLRYLPTTFLQLGTAVASTSGTSHDFVTTKTGVKRLTVMFNGVSTTGTSPVIAQIGAGSVQATGYSGTYLQATGASAAVALAGATGLNVSHPTAAPAAYSGQMVLTLLNPSTNLWTMTCAVGDTVNTRTEHSTGLVTLSGAIDRVRVTTIGGADTFDAGSLNVIWE